MYAPRCSNSHNRLFMQNLYQPKSTFLSPASKFGQRSFSASSLNHPAPSPNALTGSLREQIRLQAFKRNINETKLSKTGITRAPLKVQKQQRSYVTHDVRAEVRELQKQISILQSENEQLKHQKTQDLLLISKQNQLLVRLEREMNEFKINSAQRQPCQCYLIEQHLRTIRGLQVKNKQLELQKKQFRQQIKNLILEKQNLRSQLQRFQRTNNQSRNLKHLRSAQRILALDKKKTQDKYAKQRREVNRYIRQETQIDSLRSDKKSKVQQSETKTQNEQKLRKQGEGVRRYFQYLKNKEIDRIANILDKEEE